MSTKSEKLEIVRPEKLKSEQLTTKTKEEPIDHPLEDRLLTADVFSRLWSYNPFKSSYWSLYAILDDASSRCLLIAGTLCAITAGIPLPLLAVVFRSVIDTFPPPEEKLNEAIYKILGISFAYFFVTWAWAVCWDSIGGRISRRLQQALVHRMIGMEMEFYDTNNPDLSSVLTADTQAVQRGTSQKVGLFLQSVSYFVATFVTAFILNPALAGVLLAAVVPSISLLVFAGSSLVSHFSSRASKISERASNIAEGAIHSVLVVQAFGIDKILSEEHLRLLKQSARQAMKKGVTSAMMLASIYFICYALNALAFFWGSRLGSSSGTIYAVVFLVLDASFVFNQVGPFIQNIALAASAGSNILQLIQRTPSKINIYSPYGSRIAGMDLEQHSISLEGVCFAYPSRPRSQILKDLDLKLSPGSSTAIVGPSGSGKSTVINLILRYYDPQCGKVSLGPHNLRDLHLETLRSHISLVDQTATLFSGSILDNVKMGITDVNELDEQTILSRCQQALEEANADFVKLLPQGIHTRISGNSGLSGGQRQRICLARALVRRPKILLLDEPTSALDTISEKKILESLKMVAGRGCTIVMVAHRLSTVRDMSNIIVMEDGKISEQGCHSDLMQIEGRYRSMVAEQEMAMAIDTFDIDSPRSLSNASSQTSISEIDKDDDTSATTEDQTITDAETYGANTNYFARILQLNIQETPLLVLGLIGSTIAGCLIAGESIIFGHLISELNTNTDSSSLKSRVEFFSLMFFVLSLVALCAHGLSGTCFSLLSEAFQVRVRDMMLQNLLIQDPLWLHKPGRSPLHLLVSMNADLNHVAGLSGILIGSAISLSCNMITGLVVALVFAWKIAIVLISIIPTVILAGFLRVKMLTSFEKKHSDQFKHAATLASEACSNVRTVAAYGQEHRILHRYKDATEEPFRSGFVFSLYGNLALSFSYSLIFFTYPLAYWWGSQQVRNGSFTQQQFFITLPAFLLTAQQSGQLFTMAPEVTSACSAAKRIFSLLDRKPKIMSDEVVTPTPGFLARGSFRNEGKRPQLVDPTHKQQSGGSRIELENVSFKYTNSTSRTILDKVELCVSAGHTVGFVGHSGAGKSSVISLIERFYDPSSGHITVDERNITSLDVRQHRSNISIVPQEPELFSGTVAFNIELGARSAGQNPSRQDVEEVCKICGIHDFILSLSEGYNTEVGSHGSQLSGGQKQRIAVARALIRKPKILLLDEATSALDSLSEKQIQNAIAETRSGRTTIVVAHRLSTVQHADNICVFDAGRIVESGTHTELLSIDGIYANMARAQSLA